MVPLVFSFPSISPYIEKSSLNEKLYSDKEPSTFTFTENNLTVILQLHCVNACEQLKFKTLYNSS